MKKLLFIVATVLALTACSSEPAKFYVLTPMHSNAKMMRRIRLVLGPVKVAAYLQTPQIVTRILPQQIRLNEFHRWAGPLHDNIARVLIENLKAILHTPYVLAYPQPISDKIDYQIIVDIDRFDADQQNICVMHASWRIVNPRTGKILKMKTLKARVPVLFPYSYDSIVSAMNQDLKKLSYAIAHGV